MYRYEFLAVDRYGRERVIGFQHSAPCLTTGQVATIVGGAVSAGYLAPVTVYSLAGAFGTASTGAAIVSLHGVAYQSASLAVVGGGAKIAGGLGIAGGKVLLGLTGVGAAALLAYGLYRLFR